MRRRGRGVLASALLICLLIAGCASIGSGAGAKRAHPGDPHKLIGLWRVDLPGASAATTPVLRLGDDMTLFDSCGYLSGAWRANASGAFIGWLFGGSPDCIPAHPSTGTAALLSMMPGWLANATGFIADDDGVRLISDDGAIVARLARGATPTPGLNIAPELAAPPSGAAGQRVVDAALVPALPAGLRAASPSELLGMWAPERKPAAARAHVEFDADLSWRGSDGYNGEGGRWVAAANGAILAVSGPRTLVGGTDLVDVGSWVTSASRAAFDGDVLVLLKADGSELGRLVRSSAPPSPAAESSAGGE